MYFVSPQLSDLSDAMIALFKDLTLLVQLSHMSVQQATNTGDKLLVHTTSYLLMRFSASGEIGGSSGEKMRCCRQFIILRYVSTRECVWEEEGEEGGGEVGEGEIYVY